MAITVKYEDGVPIVDAAVGAEVELGSHRVHEPDVGKHSGGERQCPLFLMMTAERLFKPGVSFTNTLGGS